MASRTGASSLYVDLSPGITTVRGLICSSDLAFEERLGCRLRPGEGPFVMVGHFGDPASQECLPENRDGCRDLFVVLAIELGD